METKLTFNQFIEESKEKISGNTLRGFFIMNLGSNPDIFPNAIQNYNRYSEGWVAEFIKGPEQDFYVITLKKVEEEKIDYFFVKEIESTNKYFVFTFADAIVTDQFNRIIYSSQNIWKPWLGSRFLENFNQFMRNFYPTSQSKLMEFSIEYRDVDSKKKKGSSRNWIVRSKEDLIKVRRFQFDTFGELCYVKRGKYEISNNGSIATKLSLSDRGEFALYTGDILEFVEVGKGILNYAEHLKDLLSSKLGYSSSVINVKNNKLQTISFDNLKVIDLNMSSAFFEQWFENLLRIIDIGYISEFKIMVFEKSKTKTNFITEIMDVETGQKLFLSSNKKSITLAPSIDSPPEPETISKVLSILQSRVDPSINIGEDYDRIDASA